MHLQRTTPEHARINVMIENALFVDLFILKFIYWTTTFTSWIFFRLWNIIIC